MGRVWIFEESGEVREVQNNEWMLLADMPVNNFDSPETKAKYPILKLTEYASNPLTPIREVWCPNMQEVFRKLKKEINRADFGKKVNLGAADWLLYTSLNAIYKSIAIMEGKNDSNNLP